MRYYVDYRGYYRHHHLLLRTNKANLSRSMQWLGTTYSRRFNLRHFRSGHLFQGRFKSILVQNNAYLTQLSGYIHRNPLRDGFLIVLSITTGAAIEHMPITGSLFHGLIRSSSCPLKAAANRCLNPSVPISSRGLELILARCGCIVIRRRLNLHGQ